MKSGDGDGEVAYRCQSNGASRRPSRFHFPIIGRGIKDQTVGEGDVYRP